MLHRFVHSEVECQPQRYENGTYKLELFLPEGYPMEPPKVPYIHAHSGVVA